MADPAPPPPRADDLPAAEAAEAAGSQAHTAGAAEAEHGGGGLPQLEAEHWANQAIWLVALFAILYLLLSRVFIPRLRRVADMRETTIAEALAAARRVQDEAEGQAQAARDELAGARAGAQRTAAETKAAVQAEQARREAAEEAKLAQHLTQAEDRIAVARDSAMTNVRRIGAETAAAMVAKLSGRPAAPGELEAALTAPGAR